MKFHFWQFQTFSLFKNWFLAIFEIAKNGIWSKKFFREIDLFDFMSFSGLDFFNFLAHCAVRAPVSILRLGWRAGFYLGFEGTAGGTHFLILFLSWYFNDTDSGTWNNFVNHTHHLLQSSFLNTYQSMIFEIMSHHPVIEVKIWHWKPTQLQYLFHQSHQ